MKVIYKIISSIIWFFIHTTEFFEYFFYKDTPDNIVFDSQIVSNIKVNTDTGYHPISYIHLGKRDYVYTITFGNGLKIKGADDHPLILEDYSEKKIKDIDSSDFVRTKSGIINMISKKRSWFKYGQMDLTVDSPDHRYYADDILVHNCVTFDTAVQVNDEKSGKYYYIPMFELHYRFKEHKTFLDRVEHSIYKAMYWVKKKIEKLEKN